MTFVELKDAAFIGIFLSFMIGPVFFTLIQTSLIKGVRAALVFDLGVVISDVFFILIAYFGSKSVLEKIKDDPRLFYIGGAILLIYGIVSFLDKKQQIEVHDETLVFTEKPNYLRLILKGFFLNFINIGVLGFWLGLLVIVGSNVDMSPTKIFNFFTAIIVFYFITDVFKILLAKQLKTYLTLKIAYKIKRIMGVMLMFFGVLLIVKGFIPKEKLNKYTPVELHY